MLNKFNIHNGLTYLKILYRRPLFGSGNTRQFEFD